MGVLSKTNAAYAEVAEVASGPAAETAAGVALNLELRLLFLLDDEALFSHV